MHSKGHCRWWAILICLRDFFYFYFFVADKLHSQHAGRSESVRYRSVISGHFIVYYHVLDRMCLYITTGLCKESA